LERVLNNTLRKIKEAIGGNPTVLWTGNGYHIYQPVSGFILEEYETFYEFTKYVDKDLTSMFIQFAEEHFRQLVKLSCRISLFPNIVKNWLQTPLL
jgi:hypothetical protein